MVSRRQFIVGSGSLGAIATNAASRASERFKAPPGFLWGTAISAHQSEGNDTNSDVWLLENVKPTLYKDRSGDACDSYHRFEEDIALNAALGFNCYRFGIEWARIEPSPGEFSNAELDHYAKVLESCHHHGQTPVVTLSHFSTPRWFAERGNFMAPEAPDLFARYCAMVTERLGSMMGMATTFNEANIQNLLQIMPGLEHLTTLARPMIEAGQRATGSPKFTSLTFADPALTGPNLLEAHRKGYEAIKAARSSLPVGVTLTTQDVQAVGPDSRADEVRAKLYGGWIDMAKSHADFLGVQTYTRLRVDAKGVMAPPIGAELTAAGYEFYPAALGNTIRWAHRAIGKPIYVTENGIATDDDRRRIAFIDQALDGVRDCIQEGVPVHSYMYWSLLDNFEWTSGYGKHFGLVAVDPTTFQRTPKLSARYLGSRAAANLL